MKKLIAVLACLAMSAPVFATGNHTNPNPPPTPTSRDSGPESALIGLVIVGTVVCIVNKCWKQDAPPKDTGSIVPPTANDSSTLYGVDVKRSK